MMNNFLKIFIVDGLSSCSLLTVKQFCSNYFITEMVQLSSSHAQKRLFKKGGLFIKRNLPCVHFSVQLFRNKSHTLHKIQLTVVRFFLLNLYRFIVTLQKKNVESGTVQEKVDMMKKCKLCFLCTIIDLPMKDVFLFSPSEANVSIFSLDALVMRFEAPESRNRWDSPLFVIQVNVIVWSHFCGTTLPS